VPDRLRPPPQVDPLVASAALITSTSFLTDRAIFQSESWQDEAWGFYDSLGEFNFGITWLSQALSRVRLMAAEQIPGGDEPEPLTDGPAADLIEQLGGDVGGRAAIMRSLGAQLGVPGEGWLVAERERRSTPLSLAEWKVRSTDEIRATSARDADFEVRIGDGANAWRPLPAESLVCRIHEPHKRWAWRADSSARSAIPIMREIDMYNRRIMATLVSRLAMNGLLLIPQEGTIATPPQYAAAADPFVQMLIDIAGNNIKYPGGASASIPIPIRFPSELIEKWKHLTFGDGVDEALLKAREAAVGRLAATLNMPAEVLTGIGETTYSNAWIIDEAGVKLHIAPPAETIVGGLTVGYLHPMLAATKQELIGPHGGKIVVWYDLTELTARPDKSAQAVLAYDRLEISGATLRRESGLDEGDAPSKKDLKEQILKKLVAMPASAMQAYGELTGDKSLTPPPSPPSAPVADAAQPSGPVDNGGPPPESPSGSATAPATGPPTTGNKPPAAAGKKTTPTKAPPVQGGKKTVPGKKTAVPATAGATQVAPIPVDRLGGLPLIRPPRTPPPSRTNGHQPSSTVRRR
jgi:hypothetical protein